MTAPKDPAPQSAPLSVARRFRQVLREVGVIRRDQTADTGKYTYNYADINSILAMLKPVLAEHNLVVYQPVTTRGDLTCVDTVIADIESEEEIVFPGMGFSVVKDPQAAGSTITYFRRYCIVSLFALQASDDDGTSAKAAVEAANQPHPLSARVAAAGQTIKRLSPADKDELLTRHGGPIKPSDLLASEVTLARIEEWLLEITAPSKPDTTGNS